MKSRSLTSFGMTGTSFGRAARSALRAGIAIVAIAAPLSAQSAKEKLAADSVACAENSALATYSRCALMLDGNKVRRGIEAIEVGRPGFFAPIPLERLVVGDSAKKFAAKYARRSKQATWIGVIGATALAAGLIMADNESDEKCFSGICSSDDPSPTALSLILGGAAVTVISIPFQVNAQHAAARAVWWSNFRFGH